MFQAMLGVGHLVMNSKNMAPDPHEVYCLMDEAIREPHKHISKITSMTRTPESAHDFVRPTAGLFGLVRKSRAGLSDETVIKPGNRGWIGLSSR